MNRHNISRVFKTAVSTQFNRALDISIEDFVRLRPTKWLNEEIINAYFALIHAETPVTVLHTNSWFIADLHEKGYTKVNKRIKAVRSCFLDESGSSFLIPPVTVQRQRWRLLFWNPRDASDSHQRAHREDKP
jgi:hypothetical protein